MSLYASMTTAISGLTAQSRALGHVADNVANSQTTGFKRTDTNFVSYVTRATQSVHQPGSVQARPDYANTVQGTVQQSENPLALAIAGQGFFPVASPRGTLGGEPLFDDRNFYTRAGDFQMDRDGFLVNGQGYYLQGWSMNAAGEPDRTRIAPLRVNQDVYNPVETGTIRLAANLPADATAAIPAQVQAYDSLGRLHAVNLEWSKAAGNTWDLAISVPDAAVPAVGSARLLFGSAAAPAAADGTLGGFTGTTAGITASATAAGGPATLAFTADFGQGPQALTLDLGAFGAPSGLTQFAGKEYGLRNLEQDGVPLGAYSGMSVGENGDLTVNYDNGRSRIIGRVPLVAFSDPDKLQKMDGQAYLRTPESGDALITNASSNGVGKLVVSSLEGSNVDIATEFSKLILAQRAYAANTKIVTTADELLQDTINMRR